jgi:hypothetical protein
MPIVEAAINAALNAVKDAVNTAVGLTLLQGVSSHQHHGVGRIPKRLL